MAPSPRSRPRATVPPTTTLLVAFLPLHLAGAFWGAHFAVSESGATAWFPPAGLSTALLVIVGLRAIPLVLLANVLSGVLVFGLPLGPGVIGYGLMLALGYGACAHGLRRLAGRGPLSSQSGLGAFVLLLGLAGPLLAATVGVVGLAVSGDHEHGRLGFVFVAWLVGDAVGVLTVAPVVLVLWERIGMRIPIRVSFANLVEASAVAVAVAVPPFLVFGSGVGDQTFLYLSFVPIIWAAGRHGFPVAAAVVFATNVVVVAAAATTTVDSATFTRLQAFMLAAAGAGLYLGTAVSDRQAAERRQRRYADEQAAFARITGAAAVGATIADLVALAASEAAALAEGAPVTVHRDHEPAPAGATTVPIEVAGTPWGRLAVTILPPHDAISRLVGVARVLGGAIEVAEARAVLSERAATDPLTGLTNHRTFHDRLNDEFARAVRHERNLSIVLFDLDGFKALNEVGGHETGDHTLREVARRLSSRLRTGSLLARVGGDEFALIVPEAAGIEAVAVADRLRRAVVEEPFAAGARLSISAGVCDRSFAETAGDLMRLADGALYWAKVNGRDRTWLYSPEIAHELSAAERADHLARTQALTGIRALARAIDAKDPSTREHSERVALLAARIARTAGWSEPRIALLEEAALVHDVGKIGVPDSVLLKRGRLDRDEYEAIKFHAALGAQIVAEVLGPEQVAWVRSHHEHLDGRGYPDGLVASQIPDGALVLALADSWDAMTSARPYRDPIQAAAALAECRRCAGSQFDRGLVEALAKLVVAGDDVVSGLARRDAA